MAVVCDVPGTCELPDEVIEAARDEGSVTVYTGTPDYRKVVEAFQEKYGIPVEFVQLGGTEMTQRFAAEADAGTLQVDIFQSTDVPVIEDLGDRYLLPITDELVPNVAALAPIWRLDSAFGWYGPPVGITYNTELVEDDLVPETWEDLLDSDYEGLLCLNDPRGSNGARQLWTSLVDELGIEYVEAFAGQDFRVIAGNTSPGAQAVGAGDCAISLPNYSGATVNDLKAQGAPIEWAPLAEPSLAGGGFTTVVADSPHPNAARLLANFTASQEAARILCDGVNLIHPADPEGDLGCMAVAEPQFLDPSGSDEEFNQYLDTLGID